MNASKVLLPLALSALTLAPLTVRAGGPDQPGPMGGAEGLVALAERHADEIGLASATLDAMQQALHDGQAASVPLIQAVKDARDGLRTLLEADTIDTDAVHAQLAVISAAELALSIQRVDVFLKVRSMLTAEQLAQLRDIAATESPVRAPQLPGGGVPGGAGRRH